MEAGSDGGGSIVRIVGGRLRGRALASPAGDATRPTSDRVREAAFNILAHGIDGFVIEGVRVLDLFAGTGALGCEAISRGAAYCLFVDDDAEARGAIRENVEAFGLTGVTKIFKRDATALGDAGKYGQFGLVFLDPPYGKGLAERALVSAASGRWIAANAVVVVEEQKAARIAWPSGFVEIDHRIWGDTQMRFARAAALPAA
jgi:16S rRNA (guanine966-N2)-methyltransferase